MKTPVTKIKPKVTNKGYPINNRCYRGAHQKANKAEKEQYGKQRFNKLNTLINELIPKGELAGKHTKQGTIILSSKIPKKYRNQVKFHELIEINNMNKCKLD